MRCGVVVCTVNSAAVSSTSAPFATASAVAAVVIVPLA